METLSRKETIELFTSLTKKQPDGTSPLKVKNLSGENFVKILNIQRPLKLYITNMQEAEITMAKEYGLKATPKGWVIDDNSKYNESEWNEKLAGIHKAEFKAKELRFIEDKEFKKWVDEADVEQAASLASYLLKTNEE